MIRGLLFDIDGVMTDGRLTFDGGEPRARFHARDGTGLLALARAGISLGVVSGRDGPLLRSRFERLGLREVHLGVADKGAAFDDIATRWSLPASDIAFVGDDIIDLPAMRRAGLAIAPSDAHRAVRSLAHWVTRAAGGKGVMSEVADRLLAPATSGGVAVGAVKVGRGHPMALFGGLNVLLDPIATRETAHAVAEAAKAAGLPLVFKASFDKANRSRHDAPRGPGMEAGLELLADLRTSLGAPILTDIHEPSQAAPVAVVADLLQVPAFLVRQTDLVAAAAATGRPLHMKKMTSMAPAEMGPAVAKARAFGASGVIVCERGLRAGYGPLVVDPLSFVDLASHGVPVSFDVTHALQVPGQRGGATGGRGQATAALARAAIATGIDALFLETHPNPESAPCDGDSAVPLRDLGPLLRDLGDLARFTRAR